MTGGVHDVVGGFPTGSMFGYYDPDVQTELALSTPVMLDASYVILNDEVTVTCDVSLDATLTGPHSLHFLVCQDGLHDQMNMVVKGLASEAVTVASAGQSQTVSRTFAWDPAWDEDVLNIVIIAQRDSDRHVAQTAMARPDHRAFVSVNCEPNGVQAGWTLTGPSFNRAGEGDADLNLFLPGEYTVTWEDIPYWTVPTPNPQVITIDEMGQATFTGQYTDGPFSAVTAGAVGNTAAGRSAALVDVNGDGVLDVHVVNDGAADQLLLGDGQGGYTDIAAGPLADAGAGRAGAWADYDGDGDLDVYLVRENQANVLMRNDGAGGFTLASQFGADDAGPGVGANWVDYDLDGDLDLYLTKTGAENVLLAQSFLAGEMVIFSPLGGVLNHPGQGRAATWVDVDLDGRPDPYLVNAFQTNQLWQNLSVGFIDMTSDSATGDGGNGSTAAWGDYDNDGDLDLYVANNGNPDKLYRNTGPFQFTLVTGPNLGDTGHTVAAAWADFDNDTHLDLYLARSGEPDLMLLGDGAGGFQRVPPGLDETVDAAASVALGDADEDGAVDVFLVRSGAANALMSNGLDTGNRWLKIKLTGTGSNTAAIGARVVVTAGGVAQTRMITSGTTSVSQDAFTLHYGLGAASMVDQIDIHWPSGLHQVVDAKPSNMTLTILEGQDPTSAVGDEAPAARTALNGAYPNPFNPSTSIAFSLARAGHARLDVYTVDGRHVATLVDGALPAGPQAVTWQGDDAEGRAVASGTYLYRLRTADGADASGRMTLVK
jgi:hypothetical protein